MPGSSSRESIPEEANHSHVQMPDDQAAANALPEGSSAEGEVMLPEKGHTAKVAAEGPRRCVNVRQWVAKWKPAVLMALLTTLYGVSSVILNPVMPGIKRRYFGSDQNAAFVQTLIQALSAAGALILAPLWGQLLDTAGRRPFFIFVGISGLLPRLVLLFDLENPLPFMIISGAVSIVTSGHVSAFLADCYSLRLRMTAFAMNFAAGSFTNVSALLVFGLSDTTLALVSFILQALGAALTLLFIGESLPSAQRKRFSCQALHNPFKAMKHVVTSKVILAAVFITGVFSVSQAGIGEVYMYYLNQRVGFNRDENAIIFVESGVLNALAFLVLVPVLTRVFKVRQITLVLVSTVALLGEMLCLCLLFYKWEIWYVGLPVSCLVNMSSPALLSLIANGGREEDQGKRQAGFAAICDLFSTLAPLFFGQTYSHLKGNWVMLPFVLAGAMCFPTFLIAMKLRTWVIAGENGAQDDDSQSDNSDAASDAPTSGSLDASTPLIA